jgi:excisionase family DNA binding protein
MSNEREVLTAQQAADFLSLHVEYLRRLSREGRVPCHRFGAYGREHRYLRGELLRWLGEQPGPAGLIEVASP